MYRRIPILKQQKQDYWLLFILQLMSLLKFMLVLLGGSYVDYEVSYFLSAQSW